MKYNWINILMLKKKNTGWRTNRVNVCDLHMKYIVSFHYYKYARFREKRRKKCINHVSMKMNKSWLYDLYVNCLTIFFFVIIIFYVVKVVVWLALLFPSQYFTIICTQLFAYVCIFPFGVDGKFMMSFWMRQSEVGLIVLMWGRFL